jgi:RecB family endonuclease NucS
MSLHDTIRESLITKDFKKFNTLLKKDYRVYAIELPLFTLDGNKYADLVLENQANEAITVVEFKSDTVDYGTAEQLQRYIDVAHKQVHRSKDKLKGIIIGPDFSHFEIQMCKEFKLVPIQYDYNNGHMRIKHES